LAARADALSPIQRPLNPHKCAALPVPHPPRFPASTVLGRRRAECVARKLLTGVRQTLTIADIGARRTGSGAIAVFPSAAGCVLNRASEAQRCLRFLQDMPARRWHSGGAASAAEDTPSIRQLKQANAAIFAQPFALLPCKTNEPRRFDREDGAVPRPPYGGRALRQPSIAAGRCALARS
jgi:hypothetical protein